MFLVTTAEECTWKKDEKILFLGEWCKLYARKSIWSKNNYETLPYHWDDRKKLYQDFRSLANLYERYLKEFSIQLNELHGCDHSMRYWRIVIGPWLRYFIEILFDRYYSLSQVAKMGNVTNTWIIAEEDHTHLPYDMSQFNAALITDRWNHYIYSEIIKHEELIPYEVIKIQDPLIEDDENSLNSKIVIKTILKRALSQINSMIPDRLNQVVFVQSFFSRAKLARLQISLRQLPYLFPPLFDIPDIPIDWSLRGHLAPCIAINKFETILETLICNQIPVAYVEDYKDLRRRAMEKFPANPKAILTAVSYAFHDAFKLWAADWVEKGTKLLITQHGGHYGVNLWNQTEDHQIDISDRFYSWGWNNRPEKAIKSMPSPKLQDIANIKHRDSNGQVLVILSEWPRYSYRMYSVPIAAQQLDYLNNIVVFSQNLSKEVLNNLRLRLQPNERGWGLFLRLKEAGLELNIEKGDRPFIDRLVESHICVSTVNSTSFLESFTANVPSLLFWNPSHWELRPQALPYFDELVESGILHYTPESAAKKLEEIYSDPHEWWFQKKIQDIKNRFCKQFAYTDKKGLKNWKTEILSVVSS